MKRKKSQNSIEQIRTMCLFFSASIFRNKRKLTSRIWWPISSHQKSYLISTIVRCVSNFIVSQFVRSQFEKNTIPNLWEFNKFRIRMEEHRVQKKSRKLFSMRWLNFSFLGVKCFKVNCRMIEERSMLNFHVLNSCCCFAVENPRIGRSVIRLAEQVEKNEMCWTKTDANGFITCTYVCTHAYIHHIDCHTIRRWDENQFQNTNAYSFLSSFLMQI